MARQRSVQTYRWGPALGTYSALFVRWFQRLPEIAELPTNPSTIEQVDALPVSCRL
jgi:hypothetical protein